MRAVLLFLLLLPLLSFCQLQECRGLDRFWETGAVMAFPKGMGTAVGFRLVYNRMVLKEGLYLGAGAEAVRFQEQRSWYLPFLLNLTIVPVNKAIGPLFILSPGYGYYRHTAVSGEKTETTKGGFTYFAGCGFTLGNALFTAGYNSYSFQTKNDVTQKGGFGARITVML